MAGGVNWQGVLLIFRRDKMKRRVPKVLLVLLLTLSLLALPNVAANPSTALAEGQFALKIGTTDDLDSLSPFVALEWSSVEVFLLLYDTLVSFDTELNPEPDLAQSWEVSADGLTWTFNLQQGVKWHDGVPFTSKDVKFSYEYYMESELGLYAGFLKGITAIETPDDYTVVIKTDEPKANMLQITTPIIPEHIWKDVAIEELQTFDNSNPVGTGPFKFKEWKKGQHLILEANPDYFKGAPKVDGVVYSIYANKDTLAQSLKLGEIDIALGLYPSHLKTFEGESNIQIYQYSKNYYTELAFNCSTDSASKGNKALLDPKVRQAMEYAIDKKSITEVALGGAGVPGTTIEPTAAAFWHYEPAANELRSFDPTKANTLLDQAGYTQRDSSGVRMAADGSKLSFNFMLRSENTMQVKAGQMIKSNLRDVGIETTLETVDDGALMDRVYAQDFDLFIWGWGGDVDPSTMLYVLTTDEIDNLNDSFYSNPEFDALVDKQTTLIDLEARQQAVWDAQKIIYRDAPYIVLYYDTSIQAVRTDRVTGLTQINQTGPLFFADTNYNYLHATPVEAEAQPQAGTEAADESGSSWWIAGIAGAIIVVGIILAVRRKKPNIEG